MAVKYRICDDPFCPTCAEGRRIDADYASKYPIGDLESVEDIAERTFPEEVAWLRKNKDNLMPHIDSDRTVDKTERNREGQKSGWMNRK
jgi:hypothetical protein